jgi:lysophospholipase L1-like esterase
MAVTPERQHNPNNQSMVPPERGPGAPSLDAARTTADALREVPLEPKYIACIGDSIGQGIAEAMKIAGVFGVVGAHLVESTRKTRSVRDQLNNVDPQKTPYLVIQGGTNDLPGNGFNAETVAKNLIAIYQEALKKGFKKVFLVTITPLAGELGQRADQVNEILKKLATQNGTNLLDLNTALRGNPAFQLAGDGVHLKNYKPAGETLWACLRNGNSPATMTDVSTSIVAGLSSETGTSPEEQKQYDETERTNPAKKIHQDYLERLKKLGQTGTEEDTKKLGGMKPEDIIFNNRILKPSQGNETDDDKINNLKEETARRLRAYTDEIGNDWHKLNYQRVGGHEHEYGIGLGDILLDPSITDILVKKTSGEVIKAHRGKVSGGMHNGRIGFLDEQGHYVATFSGDRFRILSDKELTKEEYKKKIEEETADRTAYQTSYKQEKEKYTKNLTDGLAKLDEIKGDKEAVVETAKMLGVDVAVVYGIIQIESNFTAGATRREPPVVAGALRRGYSNADAEIYGTSYGYFQILGMGYEMMGYNNLQEFKSQAMGGMKDQLKVFVRFVRSKPGMLAALQEKNWSKIAYLYNGSGYRANAYDIKLAQAYNSFNSKLTATA